MRTTIAICIFLTITGMPAWGQENTVTYNGSPNSNECWESVDHGIRIKTKEGKPFFVTVTSLPAGRQGRSAVSAD